MIPDLTWPVFASESLKQWAEKKQANTRDLLRIFDMVNGPRRNSLVDQGMLQCPDLTVPGLTALPWHEPCEFSWVTPVEAAFHEINRELLKLQAEQINMHPEAGKLATAGEWRRFDLLKFGIAMPEAQSRCPATIKALMSMPEIAEYGAAYFAIAYPGTSIRPHYGPHNARLRAHLGLRVPPDCWLDVASDRRRWTEGKCIIFDDTFIHSVGNDGPGERVVLIFDVWHPELSQVECEALAYLLRDQPLAFPEITKLNQAPSLFGGNDL